MGNELNSIAMGERIRFRREELKFDRADVAEAIGITPKFMGDIENGSRGVSLKNLIKLSDLLMITTDYILFGEPIGALEEERELVRIYRRCPEEKKLQLIKILTEIVKSYKL